MSVKVPTNRLIVSSLNQSVGFYQQVLSNISSFKELGNRLVSQAETVWSFRQTNKLEEVASVLSSIPIKEYQLIGQYYLGLCAYRKGEDARNVFEKVAEEPNAFRARAFISLAAIEPRNGDYTTELSYLSEAVKCATTPSTLIPALRGVAVIKSLEGYRRATLKDLEKLGSLARYAHPKIYCDYLNSLAVELGEAGRVEEAQNVCKVVLASPFAFAYPEWRETANDIALKAYKSRSSVSVLQPASENIIPMPVPEVKQPTQTEPARVLSYLDWKKKMGQEDYNSMTETDLVFKIFNLAAEQSDNWLRLRKIVDYILKVSSEPC